MMMRLPVVLVLLAIMQISCSEWQSYAGFGPATVNSGGCGVDHLMAELHATHSMNEDQLQQTLKTWEQEYQADPSDTRRLRLALLYAAGNESVRDPGRAQELLTGSDATMENPDTREFAFMVRRFLEDQIDANRKINELNKRIAGQKRRISELEQQQKAIMNIEQKIQQRATPAVIENDK